MSDSGFVEDEPRQEGHRLEPPSRRVRRRSRLTAAVFAVLVVALAAFATWAWSSREHADDLAAFEALRTEIDVMDRSVTPLRHSAIPPCRDQPDGIVTRTYSGLNGPGVDDLVIYLKGTGWAEAVGVPPATVTLTRTKDGHRQSLTIVENNALPLPLSLTATSAGTTFGCFLRGG